MLSIFVFFLSKFREKKKIFVKKIKKIIYKRNQKCYNRGVVDFLS